MDKKKLKNKNHDGCKIDYVKREMNTHTVSTSRVVFTTHVIGRVWEVVPMVPDLFWIIIIIIIHMCIRISYIYCLYIYIYANMYWKAVRNAK